MSTIVSTQVLKDGSKVEISYKAAKSFLDETKVILEPSFKVIPSKDLKDLGKDHNVVFVLDRSRSMRDVMESMTEAVADIVKNLSDDKYVSVIAFDDKIENVITKQSANKIDLDKIKGIKDNGGTDITKAVISIKDVIDPNKVNNSTVIFLTDGDDRKFKLESSKSELNKHFAKGLPKIIPIGYGEYYRVEIVRKLGEITGNAFFHAANAEKLKHELGNTVSSFQARIPSITIKANNEPFDLLNISYNQAQKLQLYGNVNDFKNNTLSFDINGEKFEEKFETKLDITKLKIDPEQAYNYVANAINEIVTSPNSTKEYRIQQLQALLTILVANDKRKDIFNNIDKKVDEIIKDINNYIKRYQQNEEINKQDLSTISQTSMHTQVYSGKTQTMQQNHNFNILKKADIITQDGKTLKLDGKEYTIINSGVDFATLDYIKGIPHLVSIDAGVTNREFIFSNDATKMFPITSFKSLSEKLSEFPKDIKYKTLKLEQEEIKHQELFTILHGEKEPKCRHLAFYTALSLGKSISVNNITGGSVNIFRSCSYNGDSHQYVINESADKKELNLIDFDDYKNINSYKAFNLRDTKERLAAIKFYQDKNLHGVLGTVLHKFKLYKAQEHPTIKEISDELLGKLSNEGLDKTADKFLCPISQDVMRNPVKLTFKNKGKEYTNTYDKIFIEQWLKNKDTDPLTNLKFDQGKREIIEDRKTLLEIFNYICTLEPTPENGKGSQKTLAKRTFKNPAEAVTEFDQTKALKKHQETQDSKTETVNKFDQTEALKKHQETQNSKTESGTKDFKETYPLKYVLGIVTAFVVSSLVGVYLLNRFKPEAFNKFKELGALAINCISNIPGKALSLLGLKQQEASLKIAEKSNGFIVGK